MKFDILTLFPEMFASLLGQSMIKSAVENGVVKISLVDIRDFTTDKHHTADDYPFGGGPGMILKPEPVFLAAESVLRDSEPGAVPVILLSPQGRRFDQQIAKELVGRDRIVLICGHYKGIDERIRLHLATDEISLGDFVITGGELAAMVIVDAVTRLVPGVLGDFASAEGDSFYNGLLEHANYTKPRDFRGYQVPEVLVGGNHNEIRLWRRRDSLKRTLLRRPDLLSDADITD
ncbi:MAG TPA: tRNA (guanosine(37)-N1)-methyltransferase TrmD, partial [bacterium]|nr:tRNA (guanosine(37)-N1)-methyltransferase TrmD [bacterium]